MLPALLRKAHEAKLHEDPTFTVWGSGTPLREFLHVDDLADAVVHLAKHFSSEGHVNVGSGQEVSIRKLAEMICSVCPAGSISFDS